MTLYQNPRALLHHAGLQAKKSWGQNFLCDRGVLVDISAALTSAGGGPTRVLELGAGTGALTAHLLDAGHSVTAVERDRELIPVLRQHLGEQPKLVIHEADAGRLDYGALRGDGPAWVVAGNLPYQLSSRILVNLADASAHVQAAVLLVQREVAQRLVAEAPGRVYGLLSVLVQRSFHAEIVRSVPPGAFHPPPKVTSAVVRLVRRSSVPAEHAALVLTARAAFSARRKTLANALSGYFKADKGALEPVFAAVGIAPSARAETLAVEQFARLGEALVAHGVMPTPST